MALPEGELQLAHNGPLKDIYGIEGQFINEIESHSSPFSALTAEEAHAFFILVSVANIVQYIYQPVMMFNKSKIVRIFTDYVKVVYDKHPYWRRSNGTEHFMVSCHDWVCTRELPVLLFDIMSTVVRDPFYDDIPSFFGMTHLELMECKHPTTWNEFEKGLIDEVELARIFFKDGRSFDLEGYEYLQGIEKLLQDLKKNGYEMHAFTNYPIWYEIIEDKLNISNYLSWTFRSHEKILNSVGML